jgi:hypothetical protein
MAKKKQKKNWRQELIQPVSIKRSVSLFILASGFLILNIITFIATPAPTKTQSLSIVDQSELVNVLGVNSQETEDETYRSFLELPQTQYWYQLINQKPDYRDAYVQLAILAYNDHLCSLARTHLIHALSLDQTNKTVQNLIPIIEACGS